MPSYQDEEGNVYISTDDSDYDAEEAAEEGAAIDDSDTDSGGSSGGGSPDPSDSDSSSSNNSVDQPDSLFEQYQDDNTQYEDKDEDGIPDSQQGSVTVTGDASEGEEQKVVGEGDGAYASEKAEADAAANPNFDAAQGTDVDRIEERLGMGQGDVQETKQRREQTQRKDQRTQQEKAADQGIQNLQNALMEERNEVTEEDIRQYNRSETRDRDLVSAQTPGLFENPTNLSLSLMRMGDNQVSQESAETIETGIQNYNTLEDQEQNLENLEEDVESGQALIYEGETYTGSAAEEKLSQIQQNNQQAQESTRETLENVSRVNEYAQSDEYENLKQYQEAKETGIGGRAGQVRNDNSIAENLIIEGTANMAYYDRQADQLQQDIENSEEAQEFIQDVNTGAAKISDNPAFAVLKPGQFATSQVVSDEQFQDFTTEVVSSAPYGPGQLVSFTQASAGAVPRSLVATGQNLNPNTPDADVAGFGEGFVKGYEVTGRQLANNPTEFVGEELGEELGEAIATGGIGGAIYTASPNININPESTVNTVRNYAGNARETVSNIELQTRKGQATTTPSTEPGPGRNPAADPVADPETFLEVQPRQFDPITETETTGEVNPETTTQVENQNTTGYRNLYGTVTPTEAVAQSNPVAEEVSELQSEFQPDTQPETIVETRTEASPDTGTISPSLETALADTRVETQVEPEVRTEIRPETRLRFDTDGEEDSSSNEENQPSGGTGPGYDASLDALLFNIEEESNEQISNPLRTRPIREEIEKSQEELDNNFNL